MTKKRKRGDRETSSSAFGTDGVLSLILPAFVKEISGELINFNDKSMTLLARKRGSPKYQNHFIPLDRVRGISTKDTIDSGSLKSLIGASITVILVEQGEYLSMKGEYFPIKEGFAAISGRRGRTLLVPWSYARVTVEDDYRRKRKKRKKKK